MSGSAILAAIDQAGETLLRQLQAEAEAQQARQQAEIEQVAVERREAARLSALAPSAGERARRLHQARLEGLRVVGRARAQLVDDSLAEAARQLQAVRQAPGYPAVMERLLGEALRALGQETVNGAPPRLEVDPRDAGLVRATLRALGHDWPVETTLETWGGLRLSSADGRIVVTNTLEARLERAQPYLRQALAAFFDSQAAAAPDAGG